ncbi:MAG: carboxypeptidase regulatory-like domain-containing protein [Deltaproteobacteria bacterium]|nr:carboxypeptidase regulatory-like domain-containing protein [Deltaproteobacteria bacterium]
MSLHVRLGAVATLMLAGCGLASTNLSPSVVPAPCSSDANCSNGQVCLDVGCVSPDQNLVVQVVPPPNRDDLATEDFDHVDDSHDISLQLGAPGTLHLTSNTYPFTVSLTGTPLHLVDQPYALQPTTVSAEAHLPVSPGLYQLLATPSDPILPPIHASASILAPGGNLDLPLQFLTHDALVRIDGVLQATTGLLNQPGLSYSVQMLHADGTPASQPALASVPDGGLVAALPFSLYVAPTTSAGEQLTLSATPHGGVGPSVTFTGSLQTLQTLAMQTDGGGFSLGLARPEHVTGTVVDPSGNPVPNAQVQLLATLPGQAKFASPVVTTGADGSFVAICLHNPAPLNPGNETYQVLVIPATASALAVQQTTLPSITWASNDQVSDAGQISLTTLTQITGTVHDSQGNSVSGATVHATPTSDNVLPLQPASATTDDSGAYHLALSPGTYHFDFSPPLSVQAPSASRGPLLIGATTDHIDVQFSSARKVTGSVTALNSQGTAEGVAQATVRAYHVSPASGLTPARSSLLAVGTVLSDGTFTLVLPAPTPSNSN